MVVMLNGFGLGQAVFRNFIITFISMLELF